MKQTDEQTALSIDSDPAAVKVIIDALVAALNQGSRPTSRELSLAVTNLQQAGFWIQEHLTKR